MSDLRRRFMEGRADLDRVGAVTTAEGQLPFFLVVDPAGAEVEPVTRYLRDLALSDMSPLTSRSYGYDLLRWFRVLWALEVDWERATGSEVDLLVGWMKTARNPQRRRTRPTGTAPGTVNLRTGKPALAEGYAPRTINHCLTAVLWVLRLPRPFRTGPGGQSGAVFACPAARGGAPQSDRRQAAVQAGAVAVLCVQRGQGQRTAAARADADRQRRSRFAIDTVEAAPAAPTTPPQPFGNLSRASIGDLVKLAGDKLGSQLDSPRAKRRSGARHLLEYLNALDGLTWQERWLASGLDTGERPVSDLDPDKYRGYNLTHGLKALLCLRVITPSLTAFRGNKFNQYPYAFQEAQGDPLLDKFVEEASRSRASKRHQYRALADVCCALTTQGTALADLTPDALLFYANECRRLNLVVSARPDSNRFAGLLAWDILHGMGHFPPGTPPTLRTYIYKGQKSPEEMVDFYGVRAPEIRQLIIDYIVRRQGYTDYVTRESLARSIAGQFWREIEKIAPGQRDLAIP